MPKATPNLVELFWDAVARHADRPAQEWHDGTAWRTRTYREFGDAVATAAHGLMALGVKKGDRVGLWARNSPRWAELDFAILACGGVTVPLYDTLTGEKGAAILADAGASVLFVENQALWERIAPARPAMPSVRHVVMMNGPSAAAGPVMSYGSFLEGGRAHQGREGSALMSIRSKLTGDDLASLVYTSGTTGEPKGAMLSHGNFATNTEAKQLVGVGPEDVYLSFLPLSHVFERLGGHFAAYRFGAKVVFARSLESLMDDMAYAHPTLMMAVPRLYEKMYARILDNLSKQSWLKRQLFAWAIGIGREANEFRRRGEAIPDSVARRLRLADKIVLHKLKARVGGRLRFFVSGGAALSREIEEFFWAAGICVLQGYGLTETSPVCHVNLPQAMRFGSVGKVIPDVQTRIDTSDWVGSGKVPYAEGEICFKGPNIMKGYWRNEKATAEVFDKDGWFHTGDIGYLDAEGYLYITDRKKEILVLSNGKKVPPQPIENALKLQPHIAQACIVGEKRNYVATLLVPDWEALDKFALANGIGTTDRDRLVADSRIVSLIEREVEDVNKSLSRYEQVKKFWIVSADWTVESGELTPSMKLKRRVIADKFGVHIKQLYNEP